MHALKRSYLAPFVAVAGILLTAVPAVRIATAVASPTATVTHSASLAFVRASCPMGTNWDNILQACV